MSEKVLLLHGPTQSTGIVSVLEKEYKERTGEIGPYAPYDGRANILAMALVYRACGFKVAFAGWHEDRDWLQEHIAYFDCAITQDQHQLNTDSTFFGQRIANNKEKLYFISLRGLQLVRQHYGDEAQVFKLRCDVVVDQRAASANLERLRHSPRDIAIEYIRTDNMFSSPDFMVMGRAGVQERIFDHLYRNSAAGTSFHVSSHVDHTFTYLTLQEQGHIDQIRSMTRDVFDSVVWRGIPRYLQTVDPAYARFFSFDSAMQIHPGVTVAQLVALIAPEVSGKEQRSA